MFLRIILLTTLIALSVDGARVQRLGNLMKASRSGIDVAGATFIINDIVLQEGVLFAYRAYFRSNSPMRFQIWRPQDNSTFDDLTQSTREFALVTETRVIPSVVDGVEDVYIASKLVELCARVKKGDRLGVHFEESPGAVSYVFDSTDPRAYGRTLDTTDQSYATHPISFDRLAFPFDFSVAAYVDTDLAFYNDSDDSVEVECPAGLLIPTAEDVTAPPTSPPPPPTGRPGDTGATGPMGIDGKHGATGFTGSMGTDGATGSTGPKGTNGIDGADGSDGKDGQHGSTGATGPNGAQGERGLQGERGPAGPAGETVTVVVSDKGQAAALQEASFMSSETSTLILYAWLALITILLLIFIILVACVLCRRRKRDRYTDNVIFAREASKRRTMERIPSIHDIERAQMGEPDEYNNSWMGTMKSTAETTYSTETLTTDDRGVTSSNSDNSAHLYENSTDTKALTSNNSSNSAHVYENSAADFGSLSREMSEKSQIKNY